jgi:gamma-glutamyl hydrolase
MNSLLLKLIFFHLVFTVSFRENLVIGIYANNEPDNSETYKKSKIRDYYVNWLEQNGAKAMAIHPWHTEDEINTILSKVNGVLFMGGDRDVDLNNQWEKTGKYIFDKIIQINDNGIHLPLFGICQGFEVFISYVAETTDVLEKFKAWDIKLPVIHKPNIKSSKMFKKFTDQDFKDLAEKSITAHFHNLGVSEDKFNKYSKLNEFFRITSLGEDRDKKVFINSIEGRKYPIYAVQYHPEKIKFDKIPSKAVSHKFEAIRIAYLLSKFFTNEARKNKNVFSVGERKNYDFIDTSEENIENNEKWRIFKNPNRRRRKLI